MTYQQDLEDLAHHEAEIRAHQSFNYGLFDDAETALPGCVYIDPLEKQGADAEIFWRVVDGQAGSDLQRAWMHRCPVGCRCLALYPAKLRRPPPVLDRLARLGDTDPPAAQVLPRDSGEKQLQVH